MIAWCRVRSWTLHYSLSVCPSVPRFFRVWSVLDVILVVLQNTGPVPFNPARCWIRYSVVVLLLLRPLFLVCTLGSAAEDSDHSPSGSAIAGVTAWPLPSSSSFIFPIPLLCPFSLLFLLFLPLLLAPLLFGSCSSVLLSGPPSHRRVEIWE